MKALLLENIGTLLFAVGFVAFVSGVASWSKPLAAVAAGVLLMGLSVVPYLRKRKG